MTRTKLDDLKESTTQDELVELSDEQLTAVLGGGGGGTGATNVVTGGGDTDNGGSHGHNMM